MGTRSLTHIKDGNKTLLTIYRQYDGYPTGLGAELYEFLKDFTVVNGFGSKLPNLANGIGCLAAQIVGHLKDGVGNVYIYPPNSKDCGEEYIYTISLKKNEINLKVEEAGWDKPNTVIYNGCLAGFASEVLTEKEAA